MNKMTKSTFVKQCVIGSAIIVSLASCDKSGTSSLPSAADTAAAAQTAVEVLPAFKAGSYPKLGALPKKKTTKASRVAMGKRLF